MAWLNSPIANRIGIAAVSVLLVAVLGGLNLAVGTELAFSIFYLLPIVLATWYVGRTAGLLVAVVSAATWYLVDHASGTVYSRPFIPYWNTAARFGFFLIVLALVNEVRAKLGVARALALTDALTGAANVRMLQLLAEQAIARARRSREPLTLAYMDLDNFKQLNDLHGHQTGDATLKRLVGVMTREIRQSDLVARLGGDEFAILLPNTGEADASIVMNRLRNALKEALAHRRLRLDVSMGIATFMRPPESVDDMIAAADRVMYAVKKSGKGRVEHVVLGRGDEESTAPEDSPSGAERRDARPEERARR